MQLKNWIEENFFGSRKHYYTILLFCDCEKSWIIKGLLAGLLLQNLHQFENHQFGAYWSEASEAIRRTKFTKMFNNWPTLFYGIHTVQDNHLLGNNLAEDPFPVWGLVSLFSSSSACVFFLMWHIQVNRRLCGLVSTFSCACVFCLYVTHSGK